MGEGKPILLGDGSIHSPEIALGNASWNSPTVSQMEDTPLLKKTSPRCPSCHHPIVEFGRPRRMGKSTCSTRKHTTSRLVPPHLVGAFVFFTTTSRQSGFSLAPLPPIAKNLSEWHPREHDLHESVLILHKTGRSLQRGSILVISEWRRWPVTKSRSMTKAGHRRWTRFLRRLGTQCILSSIANNHNCIGRFYRTFGRAAPIPYPGLSSPATSREWYRPNPRSQSEMVRRDTISTAGREPHSRRHAQPRLNGRNFEQLFT